MTRRGSIFLSTANEIGSALVTKLGGSGYAPKEWGKKANIMGIASEDIPDALANLTPSAGGGDRGSIEITLANEIGAVLNKKFQTERGFKPKEWASAFSKLTPLQVKTASGAIASFPDGADAVPLTSLIANIDPKQDLHGYSKPWAPGAGKNKLGIPGDVDTTTDGVRVQYFKESGSFTVSGTNTNTSSHLLKRWYATSNEIETPSFVIGDTYTLLCDLNLPLYMQFTYRDSNNSIHALGYMQFSTGKVTFTIPSDFATLAELQLYCNGTATSVSGSFHIWLESGSVSSSTFEPYSNVCPIEGSTETTITQTGRNLLNGEDAIKTSNNIRFYFSDGKYYPAGTYTLSISESVTGLYVRNVSTSTNVSVKYNSDFITFTLTEKTLIGFDFYKVGINHDDNIMLEVGSTAHTYEAFKQKTPVTVSFGRTVYGGYVYVVSGVLTITHKIITYTGAVDEEWSYASGGYRIARPSDADVTDGTNALANIAVCTTNTTVPDGYFRIAASNLIARLGTGDNDVPTFKAFLSNNNFVVLYPLATPIEINLEDPHEVESYLGANNIYNDTGNTSASYYADIDLDNV